MSNEFGLLSFTVIKFLKLILIFYFSSHIVDGGYSQWESWSACTVSCGKGMMTRVRKCNETVPSKAGKGCGAIGPAKEKQSCGKKCPLGK